MICIVMGYFGFEEELDFNFLLETSATAAAESPFVLRFRFAIFGGCVECFFVVDLSRENVKIILLGCLSRAWPHYGISTSIDFLNLCQPLCHHKPRFRKINFISDFFGSYFEET
jgi:hypothetical protein